MRPQYGALTSRGRADTISFTLHRPFRIGCLICALLLSASPVHPASWKAGTAAVVITPDRALWMAGYAARTRPSEGTDQDLHAKALALDDGQGTRLVLVTMDLLGFRAEWVDGIAERISRKTGLKREHLLFNSSHTHAGPALDGVLEIAYTLTPQQKADIREYTARLADSVEQLILKALSKMEAARLSYGFAEVPFAVNRRVPSESGYVIGANRLGPVDHRVPVLVVDTDRGQLKAVVFGYSCHNTTLQGDNYRFHGDYAGVAQVWLEQRHPGATALFVTGTAGDANPYPRGTRALAEEHGAALGKAVDRVLTGPLEPVSGRLRAAIGTVLLRFQEPSREELERRLGGDNVYLRRHARYFLERLRAEGGISRDYAYPVQVWGIGDRLRLVALAGEVVVDYGLRLRSELGDPELWVAGYSNDVTCYIPSARVLSEGGYEAVESMIYYGRPGPFEASVEERITAQVRSLVKQIEPGGKR